MSLTKLDAIIHIGAGHMQIESINAAKSLGLYVVVTDKNPNAPGIRYADEYVCCAGDDEDRLVVLAHQLCTTYNIRAAYSSSDFGLLAVTKIHEELGLPCSGYEAVKRSLNKYKSKQKWLENCINTPFAKITNNPDEVEHIQLQFPVIIKPKDSCGSQGITSVGNHNELMKAVDNAFVYSNQVLVEEYIEGKHYDTIGIIWNGKFHPMGIGNRFFSSPPYHFPTWGHTPSDLSDSEIEDAYDITAKAALALGLDFTPIKGDLIFTNNKFSVIEIAPRFHGDVFTAKLIPLSGAYPPIKTLFKLRQDHKYVLSEDFQPKKKMLWKALFPIKETFSAEKIQYLKTTDSFLNGRKIHISHKDNTTLQGFIWDEIPDGKSPKVHHDSLSKKLEDFL